MRLTLAAPLRGRLLRRYKRFLADIETEDGELLTVHCPDPGSMRGCARPGAAVRCSVHDDPRRRLRHSLEMIRVGRIWVGVNTARANAVVARALEAGLPTGLGHYDRIDREVNASTAASPAASPEGAQRAEGERGRAASPDGAQRAEGERSRTRLDFRLSGRRGDERALWLEVKSVTLAQGRRGLFPDSVTERGRRHLETLAGLARGGERAALLFLVQRADCESVSPADEIDPAYGRALREAAREGVELFALGARVGARGIRIERELPVIVP